MKTSPLGSLSPELRGHSVQVVIETPKHTRNKFTFDPKLQAFTLSAVLPVGKTFPFDFGFIPQTAGEELPLSRSVQFLLAECRMVLPGIQALFGFQLIAVLNPGFAEMLNAAQQRLHLVALGLVAVAIALIMTPAAYHRQTDPREVSESFIVLSTRLVLWSMIPLAAGICFDFYLVGYLILRSHWVAALAAALFAVFVGFWFVLPRSKRLRSLVAPHSLPRSRRRMEGESDHG